MTNTDETRSGFTPSGRLHFGVNLVGPASELNFEQLRTLAQTAERGLFSLLTLDERYWLREDPGAAATKDPAGSNDVATLLAALAAVTADIGVVAAAAPDYGEPANLVRRIASLNSLSGGRAAWNVLADGAAEGSEEVGAAAGSAGADRRHGLLKSVRRIWDEWEEPTPREGGPVETLGAFERDGQLYSVGLGPLRQSGKRHRPILIHAGGTARERDLAAEHADIVISAPASLDDALTLRRDLVARTLDSARGANDIKIFQSATFVLAPSEGEASAKADWIRAQLPDSAWDGHAFIGSYAGVARRLQDFARSGAVDGFTVMPWLFPDELAEIVNHLIPELQLRGIYPAGYAAGTLRRKLGLPDNGRVPGSQSTQALPGVEADELGDVRMDLDLRLELIVQKMRA